MSMWQPEILFMVGAVFVALATVGVAAAVGALLTAPHSENRARVRKGARLGVAMIALAVGGVGFVMGAVQPGLGAL